MASSDRKLEFQQAFGMCHSKRIEESRPCAASTCGALQEQGRDASLPLRFAQGFGLFGMTRWPERLRIPIPENQAMRD
jgi:hypothetical protein